MTEENENIFLLYRLLHSNRKVGKHLMEQLQVIQAQMEDIHVGNLLWAATAMDIAGDLSRIDVSELTRVTNDRPQNVSRNLRALEQEGMIERYSDPSDRRKSYLVLTPYAKECLKKTYSIIHAYEMEVVDRVGKDKIEAFLEEFDLIISAMDSISGEEKKEVGTSPTKEENNG